MTPPKILRREINLMLPLDTTLEDIEEEVSKYPVPDGLTRKSFTACKETWWFRVEVVDAADSPPWRGDAPVVVGEG